MPEPYVQKRITTADDSTCPSAQSTSVKHDSSSKSLTSRTLSIAGYRSTATPSSLPPSPTPTITDTTANFNKTTTTASTLRDFPRAAKCWTLTSAKTLLTLLDASLSVDTYYYYKLGRRVGLGCWTPASHLRSPAKFVAGRKAHTHVRLLRTVDGYGNSPECSLRCHLLCCVCP